MHKGLAPSFLLATLAVWACAAQALTAEPPNFLLLLADDMTYTDLGCQGNTDVYTPHLDKLATEGLRFKYCFNSAPMCAPTRMSLYTGIHPVRNGGHPNHSRVYDHIRSMPHYLKPLGYTVALIGKKHQRPAANFPFTDLGGRHHDNGKGMDLDLDKAAAFITAHKGKRWCLVVASNQPHTPWNRGEASRYTPAALTLPPYLVDTPETRAGLTTYYAEVTYMDAQMGRVLAALKASGQERNTVVVFLSEQGSNFPHCKWTCYETGLRSACLVRWPGVVTKGATTEAMVQYVDVLPTLFAAAETATVEPVTKAIAELDGRSFLPVLKGEAIEHREHVFGVQTSKGIYHGPDAYGIRTVRDTRYRLIWNLHWRGEFKNSVTKRFAPYLSWKKNATAGDAFAESQYRRYAKRPEFELYDLRDDPYEMKDLSGSAAHAERLAALKVELRAWMKQQGDEGDATERAAPTRMK
jgi:N-sulfoglucosamine sulfohydrolase